MASLKNSPGKPHTHTHTHTHAMQYITITGNTYPHRRTFAAMGGRWNATTKTWSIPADRAEEAQRLVSEPRRERMSYEVRTSTGTYYRNYNGRCEDAPCCGCCTI